MIIFLYGADTYRSRRKLQELKEKFIREVDPSGLNMAVIDGEKEGAAKINEAMASVSLLAKKRLVIIEKPFKNKIEDLPAAILERLKKHKDGADSNIIVVWDEVTSGEALNKGKTELFKTLSKQKFAQEFKPMSNTELAAWIKKETAARGGEISVAAAGELAALLGSDLWQISNEIDKLVNLKAGQRLELPASSGNLKIETEDVRELVRGAFDERVFALTDALSARQKAPATKLLEEQIEAGVAAEYVLAMIERQFRILVAVRAALDQGMSPRKIAANLKLHPFVAQKSLRQASSFSLARLKEIFDELIRIDYLNKSGRADVLTSLNVLIARL